MRDRNNAGWVDDRKWSRGLGASRNTRGLLTTLRLIAKDLRLEDPDAEAKKIKNRLLRRIAQQGAARALGSPSRETRKQPAVDR
jgi:hypothetical protein